MIVKYGSFLLEHKFWGKTISEFLSWLESKSDRNFCLFDSETTGLREDPYPVQLTQVSCLISRYDYSSNTFKEIDSYDKKIGLTPETLKLMDEPDSRIKKVLAFNHYGKGDHKYHDEGETLSDFHQFISKYNPIFVIQNAEFDMTFLNIRNKSVKFENDVLDTKQVIQLFYLPCIQKLAETDNTYLELIKKIGTSERDNVLISSSMSKIGPALNLNMNNYHDALTDSRIMADMIQKIIQFLKDHQDIDIKKYQYERIQTKR